MAGTWFGSLLRGYLKAQGFRPYPREFICWGEDYGYVDAAAERDGCYYAFEFKSFNDWVGKGVEQCRCYANWFDYVILVCERNLTPRSKFYRALEELAVGIWTARIERLRKMDVVVKLEAEKQTVSEENKASVVKRFNTALRRQEAEALNLRLDGFLLGETVQLHQGVLE